jgi:hypothetical protein
MESAWTFDCEISVRAIVYEFIWSTKYKYWIKQYITKQYKIKFKVLNKCYFIRCLVAKILFCYIRQLVQMTKKCKVVELVLCLSNLKTVWKSNTIQLKLSSSVLTIISIIYKVYKLTCTTIQVINPDKYLRLHNNLIKLALLQLSLRLDNNIL